MAAFTLRREECEEILDQNVQISEFENDMELRRLITPNALIGFKIKSPDMLKTDMQAYRSHFLGQFGPLTSFDFQSPFDDTTYKVRYVPKSFRTMFREGYFKCEFEFKRVFNE